MTDCVAEIGRLAQNAPTELRVRALDSLQQLLHLQVSTRDAEYRSLSTAPGLVQTGGISVGPKPALPGSCRASGRTWEEKERPLDSRRGLASSLADLLQE